MQRRKFLIGLAGATIASRVQAQQAARLPVAGFLVPGTEQSHGKWVAAFTRRLGEHGWTDGKTVRLEYRWAAGHPERYPGFATEFAQLNAAVLVTSISDGVDALKQAAPETPIVLTVMSTGSRFIASLSHRGGTATRRGQAEIDRCSCLMRPQPSSSLPPAAGAASSRPSD